MLGLQLNASNRSASPPSYLAALLPGLLLLCCHVSRDSIDHGSKQLNTILTALATTIQMAPSRQYFFTVLSGVAPRPLPALPSAQGPWVGGGSPSAPPPWGIRLLGAGRADTYCRGVHTCTT